GNYVFHVLIDACEGVDTGKVTVNPLPKPVPQEMYAFCNDNNATLDIDAGAEAGVSYLWDNTETTQIINVKTPGMYPVLKTNTFNCILKDTILVKNTCAPKLYLPNAFTPGSGNVDSKFMIHGRNFKNLKMTIYSRWGEVIYYTEDKNQPWDGTYRGAPMSTGLYPYKATYEGTSEGYEGKEFEERGSVYLIRREEN
ncbi:MAG: gliding motility-associated C-terminal domain-containing protein, partial [Cytophagales bacterium]